MAMCSDQSLAAWNLDLCISLPMTNAWLSSFFLCLQIAVLCSMKRQDEAAEALEALAEQDKAFSRTKDFKSLVKQVQSIR